MLMDSFVFLDFPRSSAQLSVAEIVASLVDFLGFDDVVSLGTLQFHFQWCIGFRSLSSASKLLAEGRFTVSGLVGTVRDPANRSFRGKLSWLPAFVSDEQIVDTLKTFGEASFLSHDQVVVRGASRTTTSRLFLFRLNSGVNIDDVPYTLSFGDFLGLLWLGGRQPKCLSCGLIGHMRGSCSNRNPLSRLSSFSGKFRGSNSNDVVPRSPSPSSFSAASSKRHRKRRRKPRFTEARESTSDSNANSDDSAGSISSSDSSPVISDSGISVAECSNPMDNSPVRDVADFSISDPAFAPVSEAEPAITRRSESKLADTLGSESSLCSVACDVTVGRDVIDSDSVVAKLATTQTSGISEINSPSVWTDSLDPAALEAHNAFLAHIDSGTYNYLSTLDRTDRSFRRRVECLHGLGLVDHPWVTQYLQS